MANTGDIVVDSGVMRDKAEILNNASATIGRLYAEMLQDVTATASSMAGDVIETEKNKFAGMQGNFDKMVTEIKKYGEFLTQAAEDAERLHQINLSRAAEQGRIFG